MLPMQMDFFFLEISTFAWHTIIEVGNNLTPDHAHSSPAYDVHNCTQGKPIWFLTYQRSHFKWECPLSGAAAAASEIRKHNSNDGKCGDLGLLCVPLVIETVTYGAWCQEAVKSFCSVSI